jgi:hypothetical protein
MVILAGHGGDGELGSGSEINEAARIFKTGRADQGKAAW